MFKNLTVLKIANPPEARWAPELDSMEAQLQAQRYKPCEPGIGRSVGWVSVRGKEEGCLVESIGGQRIARFMVEQKSVPGAVLADKVEERVAKIKSEEGRDPGRKERREIKEDVLKDMLPHAFPKKVSAWVWFNINEGWVVIDSTSASVTDDITTSLIRAFEDLKLARMNTQVSPAAAMTSWLIDPMQALPEAFALGKHVELKAADESMATVKFDRHHLDDEQMKLHISQGKLPKRLGVEWSGRVTFVLNEDTTLKKIEYLDLAKEKSETAEAADDFDADVALATGELQPLIRDLVNALGGEFA